MGTVARPVVEERAGTSAVGMEVAVMAAATAPAEEVKGGPVGKAVAVEVGKAVAARAVATAAAATAAAVVEAVAA